MNESAREAAIFMALAVGALVVGLRLTGDSWRETASVVGLTALVVSLVIGLAWLAEVLG